MITKTGKNAILVKGLKENSLTMRLFSNAIANITADDTTANYTEVSGGGYAAKALANGDWTVSNGVATLATQNFTFTGAAGDIYGWFITDASNNLITANYLNTDKSKRTINYNGDAILVDYSTQ